MAATKRVTAKAHFVERDGIGRLRVVTSQRLEPFRWVNPTDWSMLTNEWTAWDEGVTTPRELLHRPEACHFMITKEHGAERWRYVELRLGVPLNATWEEPETDPLDARYLNAQQPLQLWEGSEDRRVLALMARQSHVPVEWVNEEIIIDLEVTDVYRSGWSEALIDTEGMTEAQWREELEEKAWRDSDSWRPGPRPRKYIRRNAEPPRAPVPYFARRSGAIPARGTPRLAGIDLPSGRRYPQRLPAAYWCSDEPVPNISMLAQSLAQSFRKTGVWPLLWDSPEDPDAYMGGHGAVDAIDAVDLPEVLAERWRSLATASNREPPTWDMPSGPTEPPPAGEPYDHSASKECVRLLLVPCNRPADAITVLGGVASDTDATVLSALLRSWEERFAAVTFEVGPALLKLQVQRPPISFDAALSLAAELYAISNDSSDLAQLSVDEIASSLLRADVDTNSRLSNRAWDLGL